MGESNKSDTDTVDLVFNKEGQIQALWAVYTVVQFAAGGFGFEHYYSIYPWGSGDKMPWILGFSVFLGVWAFNIGHLKMILKCESQLEIIHKVIRDNTSIDSAAISRIIYAENSIIRTFRNICAKLCAKHEHSIPATGDVERNVLEILGWSIVTHLFIDSCASVALLSRVEIPLLPS